MSDSININKIFVESIWNNKKIILSMMALLVAYYTRDVIFTKSLANVTSNIPDFVKDVDMQKMFILLFPYIVALILFYISNILYSQAIPNIQLESISTLVDKILHSVKTSKSEINVNDLLIHIKSYAQSGKFYKILISHILPTIVVIIGVIYNILISDTQSGLITAILLIVLILITTKLEYDNVIMTHEAERSMNSLYDEIHEILSNIETIITSNTEEQEKYGIAKVKESVYHLSSLSKSDTCDTTTQIQFGSLFIVLVINYLTYNLYTKKMIDTPVLIANVMMSILFMEHYNKMITGIQNVMIDVGISYELDKYFSNFKINNKIVDKSINNLIINKGDIVIKNVHLKRKDNNVFKNLNLTIKGNVKTGIIGSIGSGKTSLLKMIAGIIQYDGDILIDNQDLNKCDYASIMKHIAYIPQHPILFNKTLYHNISYGTQHNRDQVIKILKDLDLFIFFNAFPKGLDAIAGKGGNNLSGGQKQMIVLIRSLLQNKSILLLDEPTSSLDIKNKIIFINLMNKLKNKTIIINTHDEKIFNMFDKIIDMNKI